MSTRSASAGWHWLHGPRRAPLSIAHRGASDHAPDNSRAAFEQAARLGADLFEVDVRTTADGVLVAWHDPTLRKLSGEPQRVDELALVQIQAIAARAGREILLFDDVVAIAREHAIGIYVDAKDANAARQAADHLGAHGIERGVIASYNVQSLSALQARGCIYPRSLLTPAAADPIALAERAGVQIVHLCWANASDEVQRRLTPTLLDAIRRAGFEVVLWHQEARSILERWFTLPVLGICSNRPERVKLAYLAEPDDSRA